VCQAGFKAAFAGSVAEGARIAYQKWPNAAVPGELSQVLPSPKHFEQAAQLVTPEMVRESFVCGNDPQTHLEMIDKYAQAGFDEIYVANTGPHFQGLFDLYAEHVLPKIS
jgi:alkanesulfonate monooxygenase SsuD/methylene tetrahydromethanopterin reductase-like flavin-dependent oxidoreductase (luciferase family)